MPEWADRYDEEVFRAFFLLRGVPRDLEQLPPRMRRVARQMIEELGADAYRGLGWRLNRRMSEQIALLAIQIDSHDGEVTEELGLELRRDFARFSLQMETIAAAAVVQAVRIAQEGHEQAITSTSAAAGVNVIIPDFSGFRQEVAARAAVRAGFTTSLPRVIRRQLVSVAEAADALVRQNIGASTKDLLREMLSQIIADDRVVHDIMRSFGGRRAALGREIGRVRAPTRMLKAGMNLPASMRNSLLHGLNGMHHEATILGYSKSPMVKALRWLTSARHLTRSSTPDMCTVVARLDSHGLGGGLYYPETCPSLLHNLCECRVEPVYRDPSEWNTPRDQPEKPTDINAGEAASILRRLSGPGTPTLTRRRLGKQIGIANVRIQKAHQEFAASQR